MAHDVHAEQLRALIDARRVIPVVGAGVSIATAGLPTWTGLLEDGFRHVAATRTADEDELAAGRDLLETGRLVDAAAHLKALLGHPRGEFPAWLDDVFGAQRDVDTHLLHAIFDLQAPLVVTTNYDRLLSLHHPHNPETVTWRQGARMQAALQRRDGGFVLHLHGVYSDPDSVVFGVADYEALVRDAAYRAVLQALWLSETLLFIGCSFDGLDDPDFRTLVDWAAAAFPTQTATHYALVPSPQITTARSREFLHERRIQLVGYGVGHSELPAWIAGLNPGHERAQAGRAGDARNALIRRGPEAEQTYAKSVAGLTPSGSDVDLAAEAHTLFSAAAASVERSRGQLLTAQRLLRSMVDAGAVERMLAWWQDEGWATKTEHRAPPDGFVDAVKQAGIALFILPGDLLSSLKRRGVAVHERILDRYCAELIDDMERGLPITGEDGYQRENMARILTSFDAVVQADPERVFPPLERGSGVVREDASLLVLREDSVEVRPLDDPPALSARLVHVPGPIRAAAVRFGDEPAIATWNRESLLVWNPRRTANPIAESSLLERDASWIRAVAHDPASDRLRTVVLYSSGFVDELVDLRPTRRERLRQEGRDDGPRVEQAVFGGDGRLFVRLEERSLAEIRDREVVVLLRADELLDELKRFPSLPRADGLRVFEFEAIELDGRRLLLLNAYLDTEPESEGGLVIFLAPEGDRLRVAGIFAPAGKTPIHVALALGDDATPWLHCTLLPEGGDPQDQLLWAHGLMTTAGLVFVEKGSTLTVDRTLVGVVASDAHHGFAADDRGGIYSYTTEDGGSFAEIAPGRDAARRLLRIDWTES